MEAGSTLVIDLFAGPGGLGEGFSAVKDEKAKSPKNKQRQVVHDFARLHRNIHHRSIRSSMRSEERRVGKEC